MAMAALAGAAARASSMPRLGGMAEAPSVANALCLDAGNGRTARARANSLRGMACPRSASQDEALRRRPGETKEEATTRLTARLRLESLEDREEAMDAWELRIRMRELSLPESAAEELRRQQDLEGVRRRLTREQDALVREMRRRTATRPLSVVAVELERMDLQEQGLELMAAEPLEQPELSDGEAAPSEYLGTLAGSSVAAQSEIASASSGDTEENLQKGLMLLEEVEGVSGREQEQEGAMELATARTVEAEEMWPENRETVSAPPGLENLGPRGRDDDPRKDSSD